MAWMLAIPAAMAAMGYLEKKAQREQAERDRKAEAEIARWSPWTNMQPQRVGSGGSTLGGAVAGGLQGASFMQSMKAAGYGKDAPVEKTGESWAGNEVNNLNAQPTQPEQMQQPGMSERPFENTAVAYQQPYMQQDTWSRMANRPSMTRQA